MENENWDELVASLLELAEEGQIYANCPKCLIPLAFEEMKKCACDKCGTFDFGDMAWYARGQQPSC